MSEWNQLKLGEVITLKRGHDLPNTRRCHGEYPVVSSSGISDFHQDFKAKAPGVVTGRYGTIGQVYYVEKDFWPLNTTLYVEDFKGNNPRFISYFLQTLDYVPGINRNDLHLALVRVPDIGTQLKISKVLSMYDKLTENNSRRIAIIEEMVQRLYREWFVHFRFPGHENVEMVDSELGMIPEGWEVRSLGKLAIYNRGKSYTSKEINDCSGVPFVNLKNIASYGGFRLDGVKQFNGSYKETHIVRNGDIVMAVTDMTQERRLVGSVALVENIDDFAVISMDLIKIVPDHPSHNSFLYSTFRYSGVSRKIAEYANGANVLHLNPETILEQPILLADDRTIASFSQSVTPLTQKMNLLNRQNEVLRKTRDHLLPRLISSDIDVSKIEL